MRKTVNQSGNRSNNKKKKNHFSESVENQLQGMIFSTEDIDQTRGRNHYQQAKCESQRKLHQTLRNIVEGIVSR
jgi:hypothetical protein